MIELISNCDLCDKTVLDSCKVVAKGLFNQSGVKTKIHIVICKYCKYIFQRERFDSNTLSFLYEHSSRSSSLHASNKTHVHRRNLKKRQEFITAAIQSAGLLDEKGIDVLDVGGGAGEVTEHLIGRSKVNVLDVNSRKPINPNMGKITGLFDETEFSEKFHVVVMNHVLEHVFSPTKFLRKANSILTDEGIVVIEVPFELYTSLLFRRVGDWRHVAYFSTSVLHDFLLKAGFDPSYLKLSTGYYENRKLAVIRAVAKKAANPPDRYGRKSSYLGLLLDGLNIRALSPYIVAQLRKLSR